MIETYSRLSHCQETTQTRAMGENILTIHQEWAEGILHSDLDATIAEAQRLVESAIREYARGRQLT